MIAGPCWSGGAACLREPRAWLAPLTAIECWRSVNSMPVVSHHQRPERDHRKVVFLELLSASLILLIVAMVLVMIFLYQPV